MKKKIIVTGGVGYIGSHTAVELLSSNYEVVILDNLSNSRMEILDGIEKIVGQKPIFCNVNLQDRAALIEVMEEHKDACGVIHFAAFKAVGESVAKPLMYYKNNVGGLVHLLEAMEVCGIHNLVYSSSCTVYGQPEVLPVNENTPIRSAVSPYGATKIIGEQVIRDVCNEGSELHAISLRYFNPIGAHDSALIGELPNGVPNNLMPFITQAAAGKREALTVFGDDYNTPDGTAIRDYIHVVDLAQAHISAIDRMIEDKQEEKYEVFNVGNGRGYSVLEVINAFIKMTGVQLPYKIAARRPGDVEKVWASTDKAEKKLGWKAQKELDAMVLSAWRWEQSHKF